MSSQSNQAQVAFSILEKWIDMHPGAPLRVERRELSMVLTPTDEGTFAITIYDQGGELMVAADRWHAHFEEGDQAAFCVIWLLTPFYRLASEFKGGNLVAVWLEAFEADDWIASDPVFFLNPEHEESWVLGDEETGIRRYMQQSVLPPPRPAEQIASEDALDENGYPVSSSLGLTTEEIREFFAPHLV